MHSRARLTEGPSSGKPAEGAPGRKGPIERRPPGQRRQRVRADARPSGPGHNQQPRPGRWPNKIEGGPVGTRYPDGVGRPGQTLTIRGRVIKPVGQNRVIVESDHTIRGGTIPDSAARAQLRDIRQAAPDDTLVVTDLANPDAAPLIYPPGTQPPPRGPLPQQQVLVVPYP